jgi:hypothetical protein
MLAPTRITTRTVRALVASTLLALSVLPTAVAGSSIERTTVQRLEAGEVVVNSEEIQGTRYVVGKIIIDESPQHLWPILVNPFEFQKRICHRMKHVTVLTDEPLVSVMDCRVGLVFPIPDLDYVVESKYTACKRIEFKRLRGSLRDFKGYWELRPHEGNKTELTYSMYIDPGFPVPDWIIRQGLRNELPSVLIGIRHRMHSLKHCHGIPEKHNIAASGTVVETL